MAKKALADQSYNSFHQRLGSLTLHQASQMLGEHGTRLIQQGGRRFELDLEDDVYLGGDLFRVRVTDPTVAGGKAVVVMTLMSGRNRQLYVQCDRCETPCEHGGAALDLLLSEKIALGLAAPPDESVPFELLTADELTARAIDERRQRAATEKMSLRSLQVDSPWADYVVTSQQSGRTYRVALHGTELGQAYCSCPDFRTNRLGTCKHILMTLEKVRKRFSKAALGKPYEPTQIALYLTYGTPSGLRFHIPAGLTDAARKCVGKAGSGVLEDAQAAIKVVRKLQKEGHEVLIAPDAEDWINRRLLQSRLKRITEEIRQDPAGHPLRKTLLSVELLPYQMDGVAFAAGAGRAILADDMGLGKTIQGIGVAELLAREAEIQRVLVVCPASLKSQWRDEVHRFSNRTV